VGGSGPLKVSWAHSLEEMPRRLTRRRGLSGPRHRRLRATASDRRSVFKEAMPNMPGTRLGGKTQADAGHQLVPPYPDLPRPDEHDHAATRAGAGDAGAEHGAGSGIDRADHASQGRLGPVLLTIAGRNRQQLDFRLFCVTRDFLAYAVARPGRPSRLDPFGARAGWVIDALTAASRARVHDADGEDCLGELTDAVRLAEERWQQVRREMRLEATVRADLRPSPVLGTRMPRRTARRQARLYNERHPGRVRLVATPSGVPTPATATTSRSDGKTQQGGVAAQPVAEASCRQPTHRA